MKNIGIRDFLDFKFLSAPAFSPDGKTVAFVVRQASLETNAYPGDIWLLDVETLALRQLTHEGDAIGFFWTKQGTLMFSAKRDPELKKNSNLTAWYEIDPAVGEATLALTIPLAARTLLPVDEDRYIVSAYHRNQDEDSAALTSADCSVLMETPFWSNGTGSFMAGRRVRLYLYTRSTGALKPITDPWFDTFSFTVRGSTLLCKGAEWHDAKDKRDNETFWLYDLESGETRMVREPDHMRHSLCVMWEDDTALVATTDNATNDRMGFPNFCTMDLATGQLSPLAPLDATLAENNLTSDARMGGGATYKLVDDRLYFITNDGDHCPLKYIDKTGSVSPALTPAGSVESFHIHGENTIVCGQFGQRLSELYLNGRQVTFFNEEWYQEHSISVPEYHSFTASAAWRRSSAGWTSISSDRHDPTKHKNSPGADAPGEFSYHRVNNYLFWKASSMALAAVLPAPIARMTVAAPVTASPPAYTLGREVRPSSLTTMPPLRLISRPLVVDLIRGLGLVPRDMMTQSTSSSNSLPGTSTGRRRPEASGSPSSILMQRMARTLSFSSARISTGLLRVLKMTPSSSACSTSS